VQERLSALQSTLTGRTGLSCRPCATLASAARSCAYTAWTLFPDAHPHARACMHTYCRHTHRVRKHAEVGGMRTRPCQVVWRDAVYCIGGCEGSGEFTSRSCQHVAYAGLAPMRVHPAALLGLLHADAQCRGTQHPTRSRYRRDTRSAQSCPVASCVAVRHGRRAQGRAPLGDTVRVRVGRVRIARLSCEIPRLSRHRRPLRPSLSLA
jgi:hypothetical protein